MRNIILTTITALSLFALSLVSWNTFDSPNTSEGLQWSSPAAEQSFSSDGDIDGLVSDEVIYSTTLANANVDSYQQYTSGACTRSTGCSTGCSSGCSNGCSYGCRPY
jgi:hypothetical protein